MSIFDNICFPKPKGEMLTTYLILVVMFFVFLSGLYNVLLKYCGPIFTNIVYTIISCVLYYYIMVYTGVGRYYNKPKFTNH